MNIVLGGLCEASLLVIGGFGGPPSLTGALLLTATLKAVLIAPPSPASPWSIDPQRTQKIGP